MDMPRVNSLDRVFLAVAPQYGLSRLRARLVAHEVVRRHYEAAAPGRRTDSWSKRGTDANAANAMNGLAVLRNVARDLVRNNGWARRAKRIYGNATVGWGIVPKQEGAEASEIKRIWHDWAETTECDADGRLDFYGIQRQVVTTVAEAGEVIVRRRIRRPTDELTIPMQLQVLEPDFIDTSKDQTPGVLPGSKCIQGVEFDAIGRRVAYWLFSEHPGSGSFANPQSYRVPASEILHVFYAERPGQVRGVSWFAPAILKIKDFDEYTDATLMKQKIAACFSAFVVDPDAPTGSALGTGASDATDPVTGERIDTIEPGLITTMPPGKDVVFANPPAVSEHQSYTTTELHAVAAALGVTYEDLTGDYSQSNFSSSRMARLTFYENVHDWRWMMVIPQFCVGAWRWMQEVLQLQPGAIVDSLPRAEWTPPPMPMIDPEKEGLALARLVRTGAMTHDQMVRERGYDPDTFWDQYAAGMKKLDDRGIWLDSDVRRVTAQGLSQKPSETGAASDAKPAIPKNGVPKNFKASFRRDAQGITHMTLED